MQAEIGKAKMEYKSFKVNADLAEKVYARVAAILDDIFDKLDDQRVARLMELVSKDNFGQLLISDTHPERIQKIFDDIGRSIRCFHVKAGSIVGEKMEL